jgi:hypothetical protein
VSSTLSEKLGKGSVGKLARSVLRGSDQGFVGKRLICVTFCSRD